jgi:hypothetical protein
MLWLLDEHWNEADLLSEVDRVEKMIRPHLCLSQQFTMNAGPIRAFIRNRRAEIMAEIADGMPIWKRGPGAPPVVQRPPEGEREKNDPAADNIWNAARQGKTAAIKKHLENGVDVDARNQGGETPLFPAALAGQIDAAKLLIKSGADVKATSPARQTAMHGAAFLGQIEMVKLLVEQGVDVNTVSVKGETPLDVVSHDWAQIVGFIEFIIDSQRLDLTLNGVRENREKVAEFLRENGAMLGRDIVSDTTKGEDEGKRPKEPKK